MISIHTPHAGSDLTNCQWGGPADAFQSTLPMRGATAARRPDTPRNRAYFNPHSPCGERPLTDCQISFSSQFQSTLPMRGATHTANHPAIYPVISIHTPHAGSDRTVRSQPEMQHDFNPHSPCGERLEGDCSRWTQDIFQSTLPMRGATTALPTCAGTACDFNPHSPCGERRL